jgi:hypothetical protein
MAAHTASDPGPVDKEKVVDGQFEKFPVGSFSLKGQTLKFPVVKIEETGGNRLVLRDRPGRRGVKVDTTGSGKRGWNVTCEFSNEGARYEPGLDPNVDLYPDVLNALLDLAFDGADETGDLVIPTRGKVRAWGFTYNREEQSELRDAAVVTFIFIEDNEDAVDRSSISTMSVKGSGDFVVQKAIFDSQRGGLWSGSLNGLLEAIRELQGILLLPETFLDDALSNATALTRTIDDLVSTFSDEATEARSFFTDPESSRVMRKLVLLKDMIAGTANESSAARTQRKTASVVYQKDYSIFDIATLVGQDANDLLDLNQYRIEDPLRIEAGTVVLVFA